MWRKFKETKFCQNWINLITALKPMTWKQRLEHIWEYHRYQLLVLCVIGFTLSIVVTALVAQTKETLVGGMMVNIYMEQDGYNYLTQDYMEDLGGNEAWQVVDFTSATFGDPLDPENGYDSYHASLILSARVSGKLLDYMLLDQFALEYYIPQEVYMDLRKILTQEEMDALIAEDRVVYAVFEGEEEVLPIAVRITGMPFAKDNMNKEGEVYFAFSASSPRPEMCRNVWERIMAWEKK